MPSVRDVARRRRRRRRLVAAVKMFTAKMSVCARTTTATATRGTRGTRRGMQTPPTSSSVVTRCVRASTVRNARVGGACALVGGRANVYDSCGAHGRRTKAIVRAVVEDEGEDEIPVADVNFGRALLIFVAAAYGSLSVCLKLVFESQGAPTAGTLGGVRGLMQLACFLPMLMQPNSTGGEGYKKGRGFWLGAAELALWNLGNQGLCNVALLFTDATRVSFFTQASIAFTPFIATLGGDKVSRNTWLGCALAFLGVAVLGMDGGSAAAAAGLSGGFNFGDWLAVAGAASYSMYIYRVGAFAKEGFSGQGLQIWKAFFLAIMYGAWGLYDVFAFNSGWAGAGIPWAGWRNWEVWALLAFTAVVPGCIADLTQAKGQETVSASESSVLLAGEPLFAAVFGAITLGEFLGPMGYVGGLVIIMGALIASDVFSKKKAA